MQAQSIRVVRPTDNIAPLLPFYRDGLGLEILAEFSGHDGFDGMVLGRSDWPVHFAFVRKAGRVAGLAPSEDNLVVFYVPDQQEWLQAIARMEKAGFKPVAPFNPYWNNRGKTFADPDGYRVVLQNTVWP